MAVKVKFEGPDLSPLARLDIDKIKDAATEASLRLMRRRGLPRGQNLKGVPDAANAAAQREVDRQLKGG